MAGDEHLKDRDRAVDAGVSLDDAQRGYAEFDAGVAKEFVLDPHGLIDG